MARMTGADGWAGTEAARHMTVRGSLPVRHLEAQKEVVVPADGDEREQVDFMVRAWLAGVVSRCGIQMWLSRPGRGFMG